MDPNDLDDSEKSAGSDIVSQTDTSHTRDLNAAELVDLEPSVGIGSMISLPHHI